jgi:hypothetical protein
LDRGGCHVSCARGALVSDKRGRGRPRIDPEGGETLQLPTVAISLTHFRELRALIDDGHGPTMSDAVRWLLEESARRRG